MKKKTFHFKKYKIAFARGTMFALFLCILCMKGYVPYEETQENYFHITLNGTEVGVTGDRQRVDELLQEARKEIASRSEELIFMETDLQVTGQQVLWGKIDSDDSVRENMKQVLEKSILETLHRSYTLKVNDYIVNLADLDQMKMLLEAAVHKYDQDENFSVVLKQDNSREFSVMRAEIEKNEVAAEEPEEKDYSRGGIAEELAHIASREMTATEKTFEEYEQGILNMSFGDEIEIVEVYLPTAALTQLGDAIEALTMEQESPEMYKIASGDTLSEIAIKLNIPMDVIMEMNGLEENSTLQIDQELLINVPKPRLTVKRTEQQYVEEIYDAEIIYIDNDNWYTTDTKVHQQPSAGFRKAIADLYYENDKQVDKEILKEEIIMEAVPKIVERGTKIPPTYIKPISGGRLSSGFGGRKAPKKGASTYHKGIDWAIPTNSAVYASCGGTVAKAGWGKGYGYVIYINHEDGRQTRYGHLNKVLVSAGQKVKQGEKIALSGNTGVSTGPHLHFEILINGAQVNPLKYLN